jgi:nucleoside-diphosphate-sugar epimerase
MIRAFVTGGSGFVGRNLIATLRHIGEEVTVNDAKARRELGYVGTMSREARLREMGA